MDTLAPRTPSKPFLGLNEAGPAAPVTMSVTACVDTRTRCAAAACDHRTADQDPARASAERWDTTRRHRVATITDPLVVRRILRDFGARYEPLTLAPARPPPEGVLDSP